MNNKIDRRQFVQSTAAIGAGLFVGPNVLSATESAGKKDDINVALIGAGEEGKALFDAIGKLGIKSGIKVKAVCDIWEYNRNKMKSTLSNYKRKRKGYNDAAYEDYREMLDKEKGNIDAVIIATPDCFHAEQTNACLKAGLHVYCEKEMSNTIKGAKSMVLTARETGKLLQIGHQRRSNPKYLYAKKNIIDQKYKSKIVIDPETGNETLVETTLLGRITTINGQWNRSKSACENLGWPAKSEIPDITLKKYGFDSMQQLRNWRWYKKFGGGPIVDLGSHQIDIYSWFLDEAKPKSVIASGGIDYWKKEGRQWYDNVMAIFEFETKYGETVRAFYQTLTTSKSGGYHEKFMAEHGALEISEDKRFYNVGRDVKVIKGLVLPDKKPKIPEWKPWIDSGIITPIAPPKKKKSVVDVRSSPPLAPNKINLTYNESYHAPHLANFFDAIRDRNVKLNCPAEVGYQTAVMVLKVNEAVEAKKMLTFDPKEFVV